jgi:hypothetical protein
MKIFRIFAVGISLLLLLFGLFLFAAPRLLSATGRARVPEVTPEKARKLFDAAGGVDEINREASALLNQWGGNDLKFLSEASFGVDSFG